MAKPERWNPEFCPLATVIFAAAEALSFEKINLIKVVSFTGKSLTTESSFEERSFEKLTNFSGVKFSRAKNGANDPLSGNFTSDT